MMDPQEPIPIPPNTSPLRFMRAEAAGVSHTRFETLEAARNAPYAVAVMEGDSGGQIYLTCPVRRIQCSSQVLWQLLEDLDDTQWGDPSSIGLYYEIGQPGSHIAGGMGGGLVLDGVWLHQRLENLRAEVESVIAGSKPRIDAGGSNESREEKAC